MVSLAGAHKLLENDDETHAKRKAATRAPSAFEDNEEEGSLAAQLKNKSLNISSSKLLQGFRKKYTTPADSRGLQGAFRTPASRREGNPKEAAESEPSPLKRLPSPTKIPSIQVFTSSTPGKQGM